MFLMNVIKVKEFRLIKKDGNIFSLNPPLMFSIFKADRLLEGITCSILNGFL